MVQAHKLTKRVTNCPTATASTAAAKLAHTSVSMLLQHRLRPFVTKGTIHEPAVCGNTPAANVACNLLHLLRASWSFLTMSMGSDPA